MSQFNRPLKAVSFAAIASAVLALTACGGGDDSPYKTLDGYQPQVIAHRGYSGMYPEQTRMAYEKAADAGADMLELDMHMTRDCQLVARHNAWLGDNTNVADVAKTNAEVAKRKRTTPGVKVNVKYPAIASNGPAMLPLVLGAGGLSHDPGNVEQLAAALDTYLALSDEQLRAKGEEVFRYLEANHTLDEFKHKYLN